MVVAEVCVVVVVDRSEEETVDLVLVDETVVVTAGALTQ